MTPTGALREGIDLAVVATNLLGPAASKKGNRLWWRCPLGTHEDRTPSFSVEASKPGSYWHCFGCGESGDAAALVMKLRGMTFPEAKAYLTGKSAPSGASRSRPAAKAPGRPPEQSQVRAGVWVDPTAPRPARPNPAA